MEIPILTDKQCSILYSEFSTGNIYNIDLTIYTKKENKNPFQIFENQLDAENFAKLFVKENPKFECIIYDEKGNYIKIINIVSFAK